MVRRVKKSEAEWKALLPDAVYHIARQKGTEPPFSGRFYKHQQHGTYLCVCCGEALFASAAKYDSGSGWPSFWQPASEEALALTTDNSHGMQRIEVQCESCGAHLGHVFDDGPQPTGLRYCINSLSLRFKPEA